MKNPIKNIAISAFLTLAVGLSMPAFAQNTASATGAVSSLAGTSWNVVETNSSGDRDIFNFMPDGTLSYSYQNGSYTNGTWKQDGDSVYIEMNHKFVEYKGRITGSHIEGTASNVKGENWTWTAEMKSSATAPTP
jgi:osmotically-inducible protein OsmY